MVSIWSRRAIHIACLVAAFFGTAVSFAQEAASLHPLQPSDTSGYRETLQSFVVACNELYRLAETQQTSEDFLTRVLPAAERMKDCLDLSQLPSELRDTVGVESGVYLKEVLDRIELPSDDQIPEPDADDQQTGSRWRIPGTRIAIIKMTQGAQAGSFVFTSETVRQAARLYSAAKQLPYRSDGYEVSPGFYDRYVALTKRRPALTADTSSPRGTFTLFTGTINEIHEIIESQKYVERASLAYAPLVMKGLRCLDLSDLPEYSRDYYASEAAICIKEVLDRIELPLPEQIPGPEDIKSAEGVEPLASWQIPNTKLTIARQTEGPRRGEYLFSSETVLKAVATYEEVKSQPYRSEGAPVSEGLHDWYVSSPGNPSVAKWVETLPPVFLTRKGQLAIWQWLGLLLGIVAALGVMYGAYRIGGIRSVVTRQESLFRYWADLTFPVIAMLAPLAFKSYAYNYLTLRGNTLYATEFTANTVFLLALIVVILGLSNRLADSVVAFPRARPRRLDPTLIQILFRLLGIIAAAVVFLEGGRYLGFPITTLLASAGIGGLAIAFSAQGMLRGLFGTVTILLDRPYQVGDRIIAKGQDGFVEGIGLRSTKLREFHSGHLISVPNDQMADTEIENIGKRTHIHRLTDLHIPIDTSRDKVEQALESIREILSDHEGMDPAFPPRVYFNEFNPDSFNIRIIYWFSPPDLWKFYEASERINLQIFHAFERHGVQFSLPIRHSFWKQDDKQGPLDVRLLGDNLPKDLDSLNENRDEQAFNKPRQK